jgi:DNA-directed RNA polymerase specialized sigma24 family protein
MTASAPEEIELAGKLVAGDRASFEALYRRHNRAMVRLATAIVKSRDAAEEVAQDAWVAVLRGIGGFEGRSSLAA